MKRIIIVHGWSGAPTDCWIPWLKNGLEQKGLEVIIPTMPNTDTPELKAWVQHLKETVGEVDGNTYFVGHSIGCQAIMHFIEGQDKQAGGAVFVAPFFRLLHLATIEEKIIANPWFEAVLDYKKIKRNLPKLICIFSDDDPDVDIGNKELFEERLGAKTLVEHNKGHFSDDAGVKELPSALSELFEIINN